MYKIFYAQLTDLELVHAEIHIFPVPHDFQLLLSWYLNCFASLILPNSENYNICHLEKKFNFIVASQKSRNLRESGYSKVMKHNEFPICQYLPPNSNFLQDLS